MAIIKANHQISGRIGDTVFYTRNGRTYARQVNDKPAKVSRTASQMPNRVSWGNLVNLWKAFPAGLRPYYEVRRPGANNYNQFISENLGANRIFLTRGEASNSGCVLTPCLLTRGALPTIETLHDSQGLLTNISLGNLVLSPDTTLSQLTVAILNNNDKYLYGDILAFLLALQHTDPADGRPFVSMTCTALTLDVADDTPLRYLVGNGQGFTVRSGRLASSVDPVGGMAWIHMRRTGNNQLQVSSQHMVCNNQALIDRYGSPEAFAAACQSYGGIDKEPMIKPG